jgi:hypothetical protein
MSDVGEINGDGVKTRFQLSNLDGNDMRVWGLLCSLKQINENSRRNLNIWAFFSSNPKDIFPVP